MVALEDGGLAIAHQGARIDPPVDLGSIGSTPDAGTQAPSPYGGSRISCSAVVQSFVTTLDPTSGEVGTTLLSGALPVDVVSGRGDLQFMVATAGGAELVMRNTGKSTTVSCQVSEAPFPSLGNAAHVAVAYPHSSLVWVTQSEFPLLIFGRASGPTFTTSDAAACAVGSSIPRRYDRGRELFHSAPPSRSLACASCHPEGTDDGRVWEFLPIGQRRTQALRGGISGQAPYHWDGDLPNFEALMTEVFGRRMGASFSQGEAAQVAAWLDSVPALKTAPASDAARRGRDIFMSPETQCASCHSGPLFTSGAKVNVGTGGTFKVPSLVGLGFRAPYMHNGCAATLQERFSRTDCGGGDLHGKTSRLTAEQVSDLIAYLHTL